MLFGRGSGFESNRVRFYYIVVWKWLDSYLSVFDFPITYQSRLLIELLIGASFFIGKRKWSQQIISPDSFWSAKLSCNPPRWFWLIVVPIFQVFQCFSLYFGYFLITFNQALSSNSCAKWKWVKWTKKGQK